MLFFRFGDPSPEFGQQPLTAGQPEAHGTASATKAGGGRGGTLVQGMSKRLKQGGHRSRYRLRKQTVEPVFGQIKGARGFRQFHLRGLTQVGDEWLLICLAHNLLKLAKQS